jgi:DNA-binding transcriptional LysR family regulator
MDMRQLRYFLALAEELSFTRAAQKLHMTQPPLSQQIKLLEDELGVRLFNRGPRGVSITEPGRVFLAHARSLTEGAKVAIQETVEMAAGKSGTVKIGTVNSALFSIVPGILKDLNARFPLLKTSLMEMGSQDQINAILRDDLDLGIIHMTNATPGIQAERFFSERLCAILPDTHPLARKPVISLSALAQDNFIFASRNVAPAIFDHVIAQCVRAGFSPRIQHTAVHLSTIVQMVALGLGVALVPESLRERRISGANFCVLRDRFASIELYIACRKTGASQAARNVKEVALQLHKGSLLKTVGGC